MSRTNRSAIAGDCLATLGRSALSAHDSKRSRPSVVAGFEIQPIDGGSLGPWSPEGDCKLICLPARRARSRFDSWCLLLFTGVTRVWRKNRFRTVLGGRGRAQQFDHNPPGLVFDVEPQYSLDILRELFILFSLHAQQGRQRRAALAP